jgi:hypothetical protein
MRKLIVLGTSLTVIILITVALFAAGALTVSRSAYVTGQVSAINLAIYVDPACTINLTSFAIGNVDPGNSVNFTAYLKNTGDVNETLTLAESNWSPSNAPSAISFTWNAPVVLLAGQSTQVIFTLTVSANPGAISSFNFNVVITGTETS